MVRRDGDRFGMLETLREFALDLDRARTELGPEVAAAAWEEGWRTPFDHAIVLALQADLSASPTVASG